MQWNAGGNAQQRAAPAQNFQFVDIPDKGKL